MKKLIIIFKMFLIMEQLYAQEIIDFSGKKISGYIIYTISEKFEKLGTNESIRIITDNYKAIQSDLIAWSKISGNQVMLTDNTEDKLTFDIVKTVEKVGNGRKFSIIISDNGLEELLSPLGFSICAALCGYQVNIYFQGPAVKVLEKGFKERLKGVNSIFSGFARNGLSKIGHSPAYEKLTILEEYGAKFYVCQPSMEHFKVKEQDLAFTNIVLCEYFTFLEVLEKSDIQFFLQ